MGLIPGWGAKILHVAWHAPPAPQKDAPHEGLLFGPVLTVGEFGFHWSPCVDIKLVSFHSLLEEVELSYTDVDFCLQNPL